MPASPSPNTPELTLSVEKPEGETIVHCAGKITLRSTDLFVNTVRPLISGSSRVVLDLTHVEYLDSSGLGAVVRLWMTAKKADVALKVVNLSPRLKDLFTLTNISSIFEEQEHFGM
jgi:anti-sigma B factor antagonist